MTQTIRLAVLVSLLALGAAIDARAQAAAQAAAEPAPLRLGFLNINGAFQGREHVIEESRAFTIYNERATMLIRQEIDRGGLFDVSGGVRVWRDLYAGDLYAGVGVTRFSDTSGAALNGSIPDPLVVGRPRSATATVGNLRHTETGVHLQATWITPVTTEFDVAVSIGPSFFSVRQDFVGDITVTEGAANTPNLATSIRRESESGVGFNIGLDGTYRLTPRFGGGVFVRYAGGSVDFALPNGSRIGLDTGGFQIGAGLRVRF